MNINEKILFIRAYQDVKFEGKLQSFFTTKSTAHYRNVKISLVENIGALVESDKDSVIIPFTNISAINLDTEAKRESREAREADISKPAKAQKVSKIKKDPLGAKRL